MTVQEQAEKARTAALTLSSATRATKDAALIAMADSLAKAETAILEANQRDVASAEANGTSAALIDRLRLTPDRIAGMAEGLRELAALPDPVGDVVRGWTNANGVQVRQVRVPFGVVGIIYEARPNVTVDAGGICLKSGNAVLLRGSSSAAESNAAIVEALQAGLVDAGLPADAIQLVPGPREVTNELMAARGLVDVLIPRGGAGLIDTVVRNSQVPVIETGVGNCHVFVDAAADEQMALDIVINAKTQRPSVCNAAETLWCMPTLPTLSCRESSRRSVRMASRCTAIGAWRRTATSYRQKTATSPWSTCRWTSLWRSSILWMPRYNTFAAIALGIRRRSLPIRRRRRRDLRPRSMRLPYSSMHPAGSSMEASSGLEPRSESRRRSCMRAAQWASRR